MVCVALEVDPQMLKYHQMLKIHTDLQWSRKQMPMDQERGAAELAEF